MDYYNQQSDRLLFRKLTEEDIPKWITFFEDNDRLKYLGIDLSISGEKHAEDWIKMQLERYKNSGFGHLAAINKQSGELIGLGGIIPRDLLGKAEFEIAYSLLPEHWGKGYATEIATKMMAFGKSNIKPKRFISIIEVSNHASSNVAKKNGMGILFNTHYLGMDVHVYGKNIENFDNGK